MPNYNSLGKELRIETTENTLSYEAYLAMLEDYKTVTDPQLKAEMHDRLLAYEQACLVDIWGPDPYAKAS